MTVVVATVGLALVMLRQSGRAPERVGLIDRTVLRLVIPGQRLLTEGARGLGDLGRRYFDLVGVSAENQTLREQNRRLWSDLQVARTAAQASTRLERLLGLREALTATTLPARIVSVDTSPYFRVARLVLDRGQGEVEPGMPVLAAEGVVGRVVNVAGDSSEVQLAVDPRSTIHVVVPRTGGRGLLVGKAGENQYRCRIQYLARTEGAKLGDLVVTTGLGGFPRDLPVGTVSRISAEPGSLFQEVEVAPHVDFARLSEVLVVAAPTPARPPPDGAGQSEGSGRASQLTPGRGLSFYR